VLTILGAVFDKVHFPRRLHAAAGVSTRRELDKEIKRIEELPGKMAPDEIILPMLKFVRTRPRPLRAFAYFLVTPNIPSTTNHRPKWCGTFSMLFMGKLPACWEPAFSTNHHKGMPGSDAHITYPGTYHYPRRFDPRILLGRASRC